MTKKTFREDSFENEKCELFIRPDLCKGCYICIEFCPVNALSMDKKRLVATADKMEKCIACGMCEMRCPDFAIHINKKPTPKKDGGGSK